MSPEKDKQLCTEFPDLLQERHLTMEESCMHWGFQCGDGWFNLIRGLCLIIDSYAKYVNYDNAKNNLPLFYPKVIEVKEKFGALRFSCSPSDNYIGGAIVFAELMSQITCEECGLPGRKDLVGDWIRVLCESCMKTEEKRVAELNGGLRR